MAMINYETKIQIKWKILFQKIHFVIYLFLTCRQKSYHFLSKNIFP